ncbi:MAG: hypothetical protein ABEJ91_00490 [Candidatus Nanohaloarchaea archaeon]
MMDYYELGKASLAVFVLSLAISFGIGLFYSYLLGAPSVVATYLLELTISFVLSVAVLSRQSLLSGYSTYRQVALVVVVGVAAPVVGAAAFAISTVDMLRDG